MHSGGCHSRHLTRWYIVRVGLVAKFLKRRLAVAKRKKQSPPLYKWRLHVSHDGSKYAGWQIQQKPATVQLMLEEALEKITNLPREKLVLIGASRTDTGVHALGQAVVSCLPLTISCRFCLATPVSSGSSCSSSERRRFWLQLTRERGGALG